MTGPADTLSAYPTAGQEMPGISGQPGHTGSSGFPLSAGGGLTQQVSEHGEGWVRGMGKSQGACFGAVRRKLLKETQGSGGTQVLSSPLQLGALGAGRPCSLSATVQLRPGPGAGGGGPPTAGAGGGGCCCGGGGSANTSKRNLSLPETQGAWARAHAEKQDLKRKFLYGL